MCVRFLCKTLCFRYYHSVGCASFAADAIWDGGKFGENRLTRKHQGLELKRVGKGIRIRIARRLRIFRNANRPRRMSPADVPRGFFLLHR